LETELIITSQPSRRVRTKAGGVVLFALASIALLLSPAGCSSRVNLMPTPNVYAWGNYDPFDEVPQSLKNNRVEVMYVTDRLPADPAKDGVYYGIGRSRSAAFGVTELTIGKDVSWDELVKASRSGFRKEALELKITKTTELGRFEATPPRLVQVIHEDPTSRPTMEPGEVDPAARQANLDFNRELSTRLAVTPLKEVYIYVHGVANTFNDANMTIGELWHFLGRRGVPIAYTWPAGKSGVLRGYTYDRESSEFTIHHLKQLLKLIASNPDVQKINILSHSRGTDVATSALRELYLEVKNSGQTLGQTMKIGTIVLAAPDMDFDVVTQRLFTERLGQVMGHQSAIYICSQDKALGISNWLFSGGTRLGKLESKMFNPAEIEALRRSPKTQIIDAQIANAGAFGHDYFHSNPAVSSDLILLLRYQKEPGPENGRPLLVKENGFWSIDDKYPNLVRHPDAQAAGK
jgi:esterase/lipase superfamily enzyme